MIRIRTGQVKALSFGTPCTTFSRAREVRPGPPPFRDLDHPYGLPKSSLTLQQHEQVRLGTFYALKTAEAATEAHSWGILFAIENPEPGRGTSRCSSSQNSWPLRASPVCRPSTSTSVWSGLRPRSQRVSCIIRYRLARCRSGAAARNNGGIQGLAREVAAPVGCPSPARQTGKRGWNPSHSRGCVSRRAQSHHRQCAGARRECSSHSGRAHGPGSEPYPGHFR